MAFSVTLTEVIREADRVTVRCLITDSVSQKITTEYVVSSELELKQRINADINRLSSVSTDIPKLAVGPYDPTIQQPTPTPEEQARQDYAENVRLFRHMNNAILEGVKTSADKDYTDLKTLLKTDFIDSYVDLF